MALLSLLLTQRGSRSRGPPSIRRAARPEPQVCPVKIEEPDYRESLKSWQAEWGEVITEISTFPAGFDAAPFFKGLPEGMCQSPHWGYVLKGRVRIRYRDREEIITAGDAYYLQPGHSPLYEEDTEVVEFSPKGEYERTLAIVAQNAIDIEEDR